MKLNEDWLATLVGLAIVAVVALGLIGPGPQNVTITAEPGRGDAKTILLRENARLSGRIGETTVPVAGEAAALMFVCQEGVIRAITQEELSSIARIEEIDAPEKASLILYNQCDQPASITYRTDAAVRFPLFNVFGR